MMKKGLPCEYIWKQNVTLILIDRITFFSKCTIISLFHAEHLEPHRSSCNYTHNLLFMLWRTEQSYENQECVCALKLLFSYLFIYF